MNKAAAYIKNIQELINEVLLTQLTSIESAAREVAAAIEQDKKIFLFGTGHSHMLAEELFFRAGGLVKLQLSGVCVDLAKLANERGLVLITLTNTKRARTGSTHHSSGKCLYEFADIVIENIGSSADASIEIEGLNVPVAPTSTVIGSMIMNAVVARAAEIMVQNGVQPEIFVGGDSEYNRDIDNRYIKKYISEIQFL